MTAIASNGTGGGVVSAGASWSGGVAPGEGDTCTIASGDTITIDANWTVGADSATAAIDVLSGGILTWDGLGAADVVICKGDFYVRSGGTLTISGTADVTKTLTIKLNYSGTLAAVKYGMIVENGSIVSLQGFNKTRSWDTLSATANNGQKNVVTTNDNSAVWYANDTFVVGSMTRQGPTGAETDTIGSFSGTTITKAGANYTYVHDAGVAIINLTRNILITAYNATYNAYILIHNQTLANFDCDWVAFSELGTSAAGTKYGITLSASTVRADFNNCAIYNAYRCVNVDATTGQFNLQNCVLYAFSNYGIVTGIQYLNSTVTNNAWLGGTGNAYCDGGASTGSTVTGNHYGNSLFGFFVYGVITTTSIKVYGITNNGVQVGIAASGCAVGSITIDGCGTALNTIGSAVTSSAGNSITFGVTIANTTDINNTGFENTIKANKITLTVTNTGGRLSVYDSSANHKTWYAYGSFLKDTTNPRTGTYALRLLPTNASNALIATSTVPAANGIQIVVSAYFQKNASYGSSTLPFLRISGAGVTTNTATMTDVNATWELLVVSGTPTEDGFARVEFVAQSAGAGAAVDVDDVKMVYTAIDTGTMSYWFEGNLPTVLMSTGLGATDVWQAATSGLTAAGSIGKLLTDDINATISSRSTLTQADILSDATPFAGADIDAAISSRAAPGDAMILTGAYDPAKTAAQAGDAMALTVAERNSVAAATLDLANAIETNLTLREALRLIAAATAGKLSGAATATITIRNARADNTNRIIATVDADGNRSAIVYDVS